MHARVTMQFPADGQSPAAREEWIDAMAPQATSTTPRGRSPFLERPSIFAASSTPAVLASADCTIARSRWCTAAVIGWSMRTTISPASRTRCDAGTVRLEAAHLFRELPHVSRPPIAAVPSSFRAREA